MVCGETLCYSICASHLSAASCQRRPRCACHKCVQTIKAKKKMLVLIILQVMVVLLGFGMFSSSTELNKDDYSDSDPCPVLHLNNNTADSHDAWIGVQALKDNSHRVLLLNPVLAVVVLSQCLWFQLDCLWTAFRNSSDKFTFKAFLWLFSVCSALELVCNAIVGAGMLMLCVPSYVAPELFYETALALAAFLSVWSVPSAKEVQKCDYERLDDGLHGDF